jgi:hypothetical protein
VHQLAACRPPSPPAWPPPCLSAVQDAGFRFAFEPVRCKFKPTENTLQLCEESGLDLAQDIKRAQKRKERVAVSKLSGEVTAGRGGSIRQEQAAAGSGSCLCGHARLVLRHTLAAANFTAARLSVCSGRDCLWRGAGAGARGGVPVRADGKGWGRAGRHAGQLGVTGGCWAGWLLEHNPPHVPMPCGQWKASLPHSPVLNMHLLLFLSVFSPFPHAGLV